MATFDYAKTAETAERLITRFGTAAAIVRSTSTGDAWSPTITDTDYACEVVVTNYAQSAIDGTLIHQNDRKVLLSTKGLTITPTDGDKITVAGLTFEIVSLKPLAPGGVNVLWEVQARA